MGATGWLSLYLALGTGILVALGVVLFFLSGHRLTGQLGRLLLLFGFMTLMVMTPVILPMLKNYEAFQDQSAQLKSSIHNSADLLGFFVPDNATEPLVKRVSPRIANSIKSIYAKFYGNSSEKTVFIGYSVLALTLSAIGWARSKRGWMWLIIASIFFLLCLDPQLHVAGKPVLEHMPYEVFTKIPFIGFGRAPSRFAIFLMLALSL